MTAIYDLTTRLSSTKNTVNGDLHSLVLNLEAIFQRVHRSPIEDVIKEAVISDIHAALSSIENITANYVFDTKSSAKKTVRK